MLNAFTKLTKKWTSTITTPVVSDSKEVLLIENGLPILAGDQALALPAVVEGRIAYFGFGANTIECGKSCVSLTDGAEKSLNSYILFEGQSLNKKISNVPALIDLSDMRDYEEFLNAVKPLSTGNKNREARKAVEQGFYCKPFTLKNFIPDYVEINHSKDNRSGGQISGWYLKTIDDFGGAPDRRYPLIMPTCSYHWRIMFGVFKRVEGYKQGDLCTDEKLVGYISLVRYGTVVLYSQILGHGDELKNNIMVLLHFEVMRWLLDPCNVNSKGLRYVMYGAWESGGQALQDWKKRVGFLPYFMIAGRSGVAAHSLDEHGVEFHI